LAAGSRSAAICDVVNNERRFRCDHITTADAGRSTDSQLRTVVSRYLPIEPNIIPKTLGNLIRGGAKERNVLITSVNFRAPARAAPPLRSSGACLIMSVGSIFSWIVPFPRPEKKRQQPVLPTQAPNIIAKPLATFPTRTGTPPLPDGGEILPHLVQEQRRRSPLSAHRTGRSASPSASHPCGCKFVRRCLRCRDRCANPLRYCFLACACYRFNAFKISRIETNRHNATLGCMTSRQAGLSYAKPGGRLKKTARRVRRPAGSPNNTERIDHETNRTRHVVLDAAGVVQQQSYTSKRNTERGSTNCPRLPQ